MFALFSYLHSFSLALNVSEGQNGDEDDYVSDMLVSKRWWVGGSMQMQSHSPPPTLLSYYNILPNMLLCRYHEDGDHAAQICHEIDICCRSVNIDHRVEKQTRPSKTD